MPSSTITAPAPPARRAPRRLVAVAAVAMGLVLLTGCLSEQGQQSFDLLNAERRAHGLHEFVNDAELNTRAQQWADHLAAQGSLSHSSMEIPPGATRVAENVAYSGSIERSHTNLMNSPGHRANILDGRMTRVGIGVTTSPDGRVWLVQLFAN